MTNSLSHLQKLNIAISSDRYADQIGYLKDKKVVIIFDECHRSQFGDTHRNIKRFFNQAQMFGLLVRQSLRKIANSR
jgi:type I restriction enzyme R subunit